MSAPPVVMDPDIAPKGFPSSGSVFVAERRNVHRHRHPRAGGHVVQFYEDDAILSDAVAELVGGGLGAGDPVLVICTEEHRDAFFRVLDGRAIDAARACATGQLVCLDADETLATFMVGSEPDRALFHAHVGSAVHRTRAAWKNRRLRAFGEMVDLLWKRGNPRGAILLEELWNELAKEEDFSLLCGYALDDFREAKDTSGFEAVCDLHSDIVPVARIASGSRHGAALDAVHLQEETRALAAEIQRRTELEKLLREREEELRDFLEKAVDGLHWVGPDGVILWANRAEMDLLGYTPEEYIGQHVSKFHVDPGVVDEILERLLRGETLHNHEARLRSKDGSIRHVLINSNVFWHDGKFVHTRCITRDITDRKRVEDQLKVKQEQLEITSRIREKLLRIGAVLASELDLDALVRKLTDEATALCRAEYGAFFQQVVDPQRGSCEVYTVSGAPREDFESFPMPRDTALFEPTFDGAATVRLDDITQDPRYGGGIPAGHLPIKSYLALPVKSRTGEVIGGLFFGHRLPGVFTEADERLLLAVSAQAAVAIDNAKLFLAARRAEEAAQFEREKLKELFRQSPALIVVLRGPDHVYDFVNDAAAKLLANRDVIGKSVREVLPEASPERFEILDRTFETGERYVGTDVAAMRDWSGDGAPRERFFNVVYEPYRGADGQVEGIMSFGFEVTEQILAKRRTEAIIEELETASRTKDEFLATVSHELRTPLTAILGWVRMLRSGTLPEEKRARALETIERNAHVQAQLIEDLLDVSRIICGKLRLDVGAVDIGSVVDNAIEAVRPGATAKGVTICQAIDPSPGPILGDGDRLQQVVWNLLTNAVKFTPKGGNVEVSIRTYEAFVDIVVADDGEGIPPEFLPHVFERFRQADGKPTRKHGGLGLGLAIVRNLVELHGGSVKVESEGPGKGARFTVRMPVSRAQAFGFERPAALRRVFSPEIHGARELAGVRILVVDDEQDAREVLGEMLATCGALVSSARTVAEAMALVAKVQPEIVVSDIGMPEADGYELIRRLRALPARAGGATPAVALTAYARVEDRAKALVAGFNMHVPKPVEPGELLAVLGSLRTMFVRA